MIAAWLSWQAELASHPTSGASAYAFHSPVSLSGRAGLRMGSRACVCTDWFSARVARASRVLIPRPPTMDASQRLPTWALQNLGFFRLWIHDTCFFLTGGGKEAILPPNQRRLSCRFLLQVFCRMWLRVGSMLLPLRVLPPFGCGCRAQGLGMGSQSLGAASRSEVQKRRLSTLAYPAFSLREGFLSFGGSFLCLDELL